MSDASNMVLLKELLEPGRKISYGIVQPGKPHRDGVPIVRVGDVREHRISVDAPLRVDPQIERNYRRTRLVGGELLITIVGTVGETAIVPASMAGWNIARAVAVIPVRRDVGAQWIQLALKGPEAKRHMYGRLNTTVQATLNLCDLGDTPIYLPRPEIRQEILSVLEPIIDKIDLNRRTNETLEAMARAIFKSWFVDFDPVHAKAAGKAPAHMDAETAALFPDAFGEDGLPVGWVEAPLSSVIEIVGGGTPKTKVAEYWDGDIPWFSVVDAPSESDMWVIDTEKRITDRGLAESSTRLLDERTTIITARGTVGKVAFTGRPMTMNQSCYGIRGMQDWPQEFTFFLVRNAVKQLQANAHGSVFDTITRGTFDNIMFSRGPEAVAAAFGATVAPWMNKALLNVEESQTLAALRDLLLPKLMSGETSLRGGEEVTEAVRL